MQSFNPIANGKRLRELRGDRPLHEVAEIIGVTDTALCQYEAGKRTPRDQIKIALSQFYKVPVHKLFYSD